MENFEEIFLAVINGEVPLRKLKEKYGVGVKQFKAECDRRFPIGTPEREKLTAILKANKSNPQRIEIKPEILAKTVDGLISGEIPTLSEASGEIGVDIQTLQEHILDYINKADDEIKRRYIEYEAKKHPNYSHINFKSLVIEMIRMQETQSAMANKYGIPTRTVSRELAKLEKDEDFAPVYRIAKELASRQMKHGNSRVENKTKMFNPFEQSLIDDTLDFYDEGPIVIGIPKTERATRYEKAKELMKKRKALGKMTNKEAARKLGVSVSTLRRARITIANYENLQGGEEKDVEPGTPSGEER